MAEKKYTGFAALHALDQAQAKPALVSPTEKAQKNGEQPSSIGEGEPKLRAVEDMQSSPETGQLVNQKLVNQLTSVANQSTNNDSLANQSTSQPVNQSPNELVYPSRKHKLLMGVRLPSQKVERYKIWCFLNKTNMQDAVEQAMDWLTSQPVNQLTTYQFDDSDDTLINDETSSVIDFYAKWTHNKVTEKDKQASQEVSHLAPEVIKAGILLSVQRAKGKINSFRYCLGAIEEAAESGMGAQADYMKYLMSKLENDAKGK